MGHELQRATGLGLPTGKEFRLSLDAGWIINRMLEDECLSIGLARPYSSMMR